MAQQHPPAAVSLQSQCIEGISFCVISLKQSQISIPFVPNDFSTSETSNGDQHLVLSKSKMSRSPREIVDKTKGRIQDDFPRNMCCSRDRNEASLPCSSLSSTNSFAGKDSVQEDREQFAFSYALLSLPSLSVFFPSLIEAFTGRNPAFSFRNLTTWTS